MLAPVVRAVIAFVAKQTAAAATMTGPSVTASAVIAAAHNGTSKRRARPLVEERPVHALGKVFAQLVAVGAAVEVVDVAQMSHIEVVVVVVVHCRAPLVAVSRHCTILAPVVEKVIALVARHIVASAMAPGPSSTASAVIATRHNGTSMRRPSPFVPERLVQELGRTLAQLLPLHVLMPRAVSRQDIRLFPVVKAVIALVARHAVASTKPPTARTGDSAVRAARHKTASGTRARPCEAERLAQFEGS